MDNDSIQIHLSSKNATIYNNTLLNDVTFNLPIIEVPSEYQLYLSIEHAVIPYSFYNIDNNNNYLKIITDNEIINLYITPGNYNVYNLMDYLNLNLINFVITYNNITNKYTFTNTLYNFSINSSSTSLNLLGFKLNSNVNTSVNKILICPYIVNLFSKQCICISSDFSSGSINNSLTNNYTIIASIPVITAPNSLLTYSNLSKFKFNLYSNLLNKIRIILKDQNGNNIDMNGAFFSLTIQISSVQFVE
jgi:hypothetical protein